MSRYARDTSVNADRSRAEIERILMRYGAEEFYYATKRDAAVIGFKMQDRMIRILLPMPPRDADEFRNTPAGRRRRSSEAAYTAWEQAVRQKWRALALVIKAKLEAIESGIATFEDEFLAHIVLPGGMTLGEWARPQIAEAYETGGMPRLLKSFN